MTIKVRGLVMTMTMMVLRIVMAITVVTMVMTMKMMVTRVVVGY